MIEPENRADESIDALVRRNLDRLSERIDPRPAFERLQADWPVTWDVAEAQDVHPPGGRRGSGRGRRRPRFAAPTLVWGLSGAAATLLILATWLLPPSPVQASPESLVREAKQVHRMPLDRCYLVEVRKNSPIYDECFPMTAQVRLTRLWTRGDRFWIQSIRPDRCLDWGRDERNRVWFAFERRRAVRLEPGEAPRWLNLCCDLYCIRLEPLLGTVLRDFQLERESPGDPSDPTAAPATQVVRATMKPGRTHPSIKTVRLEIDAETRVVRRMVIERMYRGQPFATVTCTLAETATLDDDQFQLEGHLDVPYTIYTHEFEPAQRRELLIRWFGPQVGSWFRLPEPAKS